LLLLRIEEELPKAAVTAVSIKAEPVKPRSTQNGLFQPLAPEPEKLELTIARIAKLVGAQNVGSPEILDTHRPGAFRMKRFQVVRNSLTRSRRRTNGQSKPASRSDEVEYRLGFRAFRPPLRAEVQAPRGYPDRIRARDARNAGRNINGRISQKAGPWRTTGDWWAEDGWARDEWDVAVGDSKTGSLFRIYRDLQTGEWFVEGMYD
jgi:protein ImuB